MIATIKKRADFLAVRGGVRFSAQAFLVEAKQRQQPGARDAAPLCGSGQNPRFGLTVTKKLGGAVVRNRIRRRLKAALAKTSPGLVRPQFDYVVVARPPAFTLPFETLTRDFVRAFRHIHKADRDAPQGSG